MAEFTLEQQKLLALAAERRRTAESNPETAQVSGDDRVERAKRELRRRKAVQELERRVPSIDGGGSTQFLITAPNGKRYRVSGETQEGALAALQKHLSTASQASPLDAMRKKAAEVSQATRDNSLVEDVGVLARNADAMVRGAADTLSFGFADEIAAGADTALGLGDGFDKNLATQRARDAADAENLPAQRLSGQIVGGVTQGTALAKGGLSVTSNAITRGASLPKVMMLGGAEGATLSAAHGLGSGDELADRIDKASMGALIGGPLGIATPAVVAGVKAVADPVKAWLSPQSARDKVMAALLKRSGLTADQLAMRLQRAQDDGQSMYMAADALELPGQRIMSTAARTPTDARKQVVDALVDRQTSQGDRLAQYLAEGFDAPDTAAQRIATLTTDRANTARVNYDAARNSANAVDPSAAIAKADEYLQPGSMSLMSNDTGIADTSIASAVQKAKRFLTDGNSVVSDFNAAFNAKKEIDALIENASPTIQRELIPIRDSLDEALASASAPYSTARDTFRAQSKAIDAVDAGKLAASSRVRSADSIPTFQGMKPDEQSAFRAGYADPLITRIEAASMSPTTNKARPLMSMKTAEEFPAFAVPGKAEQMGDRIAREQRMFETANAALGGSKTADNFADMADSAIDPGIIAALARGSIKDAALSALTQGVNAARGLPPAVVERLIPALMETNPAYAREIYSKSAQNVALSDRARAEIVAALLSSQGATISRAPY